MYLYRTFRNKTPTFSHALLHLFGKGQHAECCGFPWHPMVSFCWQKWGLAKSVWTLAVMTQFRNNLYSWMLIFEFHTTFMCQELFFLFWFFFFSPAMEICSDQQKPQLGGSMQLWPTGCNRSVSKFLLESRILLCLFWHCPLLACACVSWLSGYHKPFLSRQSPPVYNRCLLNAFQMSGVAIIPLAAWPCLHETFWKWCLFPRKLHLSEWMRAGRCVAACAWCCLSAAPQRLL